MALVVLPHRDRARSPAFQRGTATRLSTCVDNPVEKGDFDASLRGSHRIRHMRNPAWRSLAFRRFINRKKARKDDAPAPVDKCIRSCIECAGAGPH